MVELRQQRECADCGAILEIHDDAIMGEIISCRDCGSDWELTSDLELKKTERIGEDWGE